MAHKINSGISLAKILESFDKEYETQKKLKELGKVSKIEIDIPQDFFDVIRIIVKEELESLLKNTTFNSLNNLQLKDRYLNVKEAAELFQVSDKTIRTYIGEGMPHVRIGQQIRLNKHEILNWFTTNSRN